MRIQQNVRIVGCGGVGAWIAMALTRMASNVTLMDGDRIELKNIDRQLFTDDDIGEFKADALRRRVSKMGGQCEFKSDSTYLTPFPSFPEEVLVVAVDNHPARAHSLEWADRTGGLVITAANETDSGESYAYRREWRDTPLDPRIKYPDLLTDHSGDPLSPCSQASSTNIQLAVSNYMAASSAVWLLWFWCIKRGELTPDMEPHFPKHVAFTPTHLHVWR